MMGDYSKLNNMTEAELREFAIFAYTASPTLLVTHEKRQAFFKEYPNRDSEVPYQGELDLQSRSNDGENLQATLESRGLRARDFE